MLFALAFSGVLTAIGMALASHTIGANFLGSSAFLSNTGSSLYPFTAPAFFFLFVAMLTKSPVLIAIIGISFTVGIVAILPPSFLVGTRSIFAWSFDRIVPTKLSDVEEHTRSPLIANLCLFVLAEIVLLFIAFGGNTALQIAFSTQLGQVMTFVLVAIAAMVYPYRRRDLYRASGAQKSLLGIPQLVWLAIGSLALYGLLIGVLLTNDAVGANTTAGIVTWIVTPAVALASYGISYVVNRRRGVDLRLAGRELPPE